ncbi:glycosyl hydrolase catalytic core domain-containing protein [Sarocladium implicatum]|nr:glycosyl hydrolase catalytic core domain-containing protein [Sarocladium implicatum]
MINKLALLTAAAAMAQQVSGLSAHRHIHDVMEKRALDAEKRVAELEARGVVTQTVWHYVTTTIQWSPDMDSPPPTDAAVVVEQAPAAPAPAPAPTTLAKVVMADNSNAPAVEAPAAEVPATESVSEAPKEEKKPQQNKSKQEKKPKEDKKPSNEGSSSAAPFSGKRGIAYNIAELANTFGDNCESCVWGYNWASRRDDFSSKYDFVPMLWGNAAEWTNDWEANAKDMIAQGSKALFSFNEPDIASQANLTPDQAAQDFKTYMNPFSGDALIGAPAVSNSGNENEGLDWLQKFVDSCNGECKFDFCNVHWYSEPQYADTLYDHIKKAHEICGKPVWLTEFAPLGSGPAVDSFIETVIPELDKIEYLDAYSYFMVSQDHLMAGDGLSSAGKMYATVA